MANWICKGVNTFQFTRPRGARPERQAIYRVASCFNSRAREGRDSSCSKARPTFPCFNSRAREGRDIRRTLARRLANVSIHAPARGATVCGFLSLGGGDVSIHAPARGATQGPSTPSHRASFNSRAREGRDSIASSGRSAKEWFQFTRPRGARLISATNSSRE